MGYVEQERSRGFLHVHGVGTGHAIAHIIFRAEDMRDAGEDLRLMLADPEQFGEGEVGQRGVGGELDEPLAANRLVEPFAFGVGTLVAPDQRRAQDFSCGIEHDGSVHLAGESDGFDYVRRWPAIDVADGLLRGAPPVFGVLLGPSGLWATEGSVFAGG